MTIWLSIATNDAVQDSMTENLIYLTEEEFAERYHFGRRTLQRWRRTGEGPCWCRLGPRRILYRLSDIEDWAGARTFAHRADELSRQSTA
jgi:predicted DNA-binding transcriptional regulator AlpA